MPAYLVIIRVKYAVDSAYDVESDVESEGENEGEVVEALPQPAPLEAIVADPTHQAQPPPTTSSEPDSLAAPVPADAGGSAEALTGATGLVSGEGGQGGTGTDGDGGSRAGQAVVEGGAAALASPTVNRFARSSAGAVATPESGGEAAAVTPVEGVSRFGVQRTGSVGVADVPGVNDVNDVNVVGSATPHPRPVTPAQVSVSETQNQDPTPEALLHCMSDARSVLANQPLTRPSILLLSDPLDIFFLLWARSGYRPMRLEWSFSKAARIGTTLLPCSENPQPQCQRKKMTMRTD